MNTYTSQSHSESAANDYFSKFPFLKGYGGLKGGGVEVLASRSTPIVPVSPYCHWRPKYGMAITLTLPSNTVPSTYATGPGAE